MEQTPRQTTTQPGPDEQSAGPVPPAREGPAGLVLCLTILSYLMAVVGALGCLVTGLGPGAGEPSWRQLVTALMCLLMGLSLACALWALSWIIRCQFETAMAQRRALSLLTGVAPPPVVLPPPRPIAAPSSRPEPVGEELLAAVRELNANLLLTPDEREVKRRWQQEHLGDELAQQAGVAIESGDFVKAEGLLHRMRVEFPSDARAGELAESLAQARAAAVEEEIAHARTKAGDLMALAKFQDARDVALLLRSRYPQEPRAAALLETVSREADAFLGEQRKRLYGELERHVSDRRWRSALAAARTFLEKFPDSSEAKIVAVQLQTIEDNARLEEVRDLRDQFRDCLDRKRHAEALRLAREVIRRFPGTAAANELLQQLPRLEERAAGGGGAA